MSEQVPMAPPVQLPNIDETTGRGQLIRKSEKNFGMKCVDTMGRQTAVPRPAVQPRNVSVDMDAYTRQFGNQGND